VSLYFEGHITTEGRLSDDLIAKAKESCRDFWTSQIERDEGDDVLGTFFTTRHYNVQALRSDMRRLVDLLQLHGVKVARAKVEFAVLDTKHGDVL
jgi:hypothetical protein